MCVRYIKLQITLETILLIFHLPFFYLSLISGISRRMHSVAQQNYVIQKNVCSVDAWRLFASKTDRNVWVEDYTVWFRYNVFHCETHLFRDRLLLQLFQQNCSSVHLKICPPVANITVFSSILSSNHPGGSFLPVSKPLNCLLRTASSNTGTEEGNQKCPKM